MDRWNGKVAVVTGASAGIGEAIVEQLVEHGMTVIGIARRFHLVEAQSKKLQGKPGSLHALKVDITKPEEIISAFKFIEEKFQHIHVLINNAGIFTPTSLTKGDIELWRQTIDTNLFGLCVTTREALENMKKSGVDGHIVLINSMAGHRVPILDELNMYPVTKFAVTAHAQALAVELRNTGSKTKITSISPAFCAGTEMSDYTPRDKFLLPQDVADAIIYVLSTSPHVQIQELMLQAVGDKDY